jgi:hypothetical protein
MPPLWKTHSASFKFAQYEPFSKFRLRRTVAIQHFLAASVRGEETSTLADRQRAFQAEWDEPKQPRNEAAAVKKPASECDFHQSLSRCFRTEPGNGRVAD